MNKPDELISQLFSIRNQYGKKYSEQKLNLLNAISADNPKTKKGLQSWYDVLLFLTAYPDNRPVYKAASKGLRQLESYINSYQNVQTRLFNSGLTNTKLRAAFSFEIVKWLRKRFPKDITLGSFESDDAQIQSILSVVMPKVESEIMQDGNADWRSWLKASLTKREDTLDKLISIFDQTDIRPEVKDELWGAIGINVEVNFSSHVSLPQSLIDPYYHRSLIKKRPSASSGETEMTRIDINDVQAEQIIDCGRMILVRHLREIDPITFTAAPFVSFYHLPRGLSIALMGMVPERRHPIDSYMGYVVFKNGVPVAYAGSWILFDSGRIGLNIFPAYRGGESQYIFQQVLRAHSKAYRLDRFSVDPYQIGKDNSDGITSGAFWTYYHAGFRPIRIKQQQLADREAAKIKSTRGYRSPSGILKILADSRMEMLLKKSAVRFDATDLSRAYAGILKERWNDNRKLAEEVLFTKLATLLTIKNHNEEKMKFVLKNWCVLLLSGQVEVIGNKKLKTILKTLFEQKTHGAEEDYILGLQKTTELKKLLDTLVRQTVVNK